MCLPLFKFGQSASVKLPLSLTHVPFPGTGIGGVGGVGGGGGGSVGGGVGGAGVGGGVGGTGDGGPGVRLSMRLSCALTGRLIDPACVPRSAFAHKSRTRKEAEGPTLCPGSTAAHEASTVCALVASMFTSTTANLPPES